MSFPTPNSDENLTTPAIPFIGNFHKTLPHNDYGEVSVEAYREFMQTCLAVEAGMPINFQEVPKGPNTTADAPLQSAFHADADTSVAKFTSPLAGAASETHGPDPKSLDMLPAPGIQSISTAAEMAEIYSMALLRDVPLVAFQANGSPPFTNSAGCTGEGVSATDIAAVGKAMKRLNTLFDFAVTCDTDPGKLRAPLDLDDGKGGAELTLQTLFRTGLHDEQFGPLISQFFIRTVGYGTQLIDQKQVPYIHGKNFLTTHGDWLLAQNTGKDKYGRSYGDCNNYGDQVAGHETYYPLNADGTPLRRYISTMRDLARFVNRDALHQAYFNAALFLDGIGAPLDTGNPYRGNCYGREAAFASIGGPDLLTLVSEVASRALKVVWRQKWLVHRRCRPEIYGGLLHMQRVGADGIVNPSGGGDDATQKHRNRDYGIATLALAASHHCDGSNKCEQRMAKARTALDEILQEVQTRNSGTLFLPMAFSAGSPTHPAYGAGHATVAGACVTVLKAWFDEDVTLKSVLDAANQRAMEHTGPKDPSGGQLEILQPGYRKAGGDVEDFCVPQPYAGSDLECMTVGGELNKLASNVAMGRTMGGVHWRSDNTRSLRLGEAIAIEILRKRTLEYAERPVSFTFRAFDRHIVHITQGQVQTR
ncbi:MAG: hypothetical protein B7Y26_08745 [Hydrogenophilales bacterium 16-64-46]|nr:MAG: hypothetical protein B7Z32_09325 [Hydrogenophilales bacterium 12-64-13]OYZ05353.1 MAG: hypothetical protein B7Y26_08745 [Hydrogenophilales bacterium 16-64-46]OZA37707.1 MAG: hypothetical protein B7X87_09415 [Hydrogenophilales bacterium 17-64-34]HQS99347.1 vanadium-dependent haloperoxidase [Thiobacillus sp.]